MKVVVPAAGLGTRLLPITNAIAKEMLPILDKPAIQYVLEEAVAAGLHDFVIIAGSSKHSLVRYFDTMPPNTTTKNVLQNQHLQQLIALQHEHFMFVPQHEPLGLGHAVLCARPAIAEPFFAVMLPDDIYLAPQPPIGVLKQVALRYNASVIAVKRVPTAQLVNYGVISIDKIIEQHIFSVNKLVEKPQENPPSSFAIVGRYILSSVIFDYLAAMPIQQGKEMQLTDAIDMLVKNGHTVLAVEVEGERFDVGTPVGLFEASLAFARFDERFASALAKIKLSS